jgi:hypothetical protein
LGYKTITIELGNGIPDQWMTSSKIFCSINDIFEIAEHQAVSLRLRGLKVERIKIESDPSKLTRLPKSSNCMYLEVHIPIKLLYKNEAYIRSFSKLFGLHISKNASKRFEDHQILFGTYRIHINNFDEILDFRESVKRIFQYLMEIEDKKLIISFEKLIELELAWYDSNLELDNQWLYQ